MSEKINNNGSYGKKQKRDDLKREYLRGITEATQIRKTTTKTMLNHIRDELDSILNDAILADEYDKGIEKVIKTIDDYLIEEVPADEIINRENSDEDLPLLKMDGDEVISLLDFVDKKDQN